MKEALMRSILLLALAVSVCTAESKPKRKPREDAGVQEAIAFQRAKDRADARQARLQQRHPEHFTPAAPQQNGPNSLANEQRQEALERERQRREN
jgi:hypothetical protein